METKTETRGRRPLKYPNTYFGMALEDALIARLKKMYPDEKNIQHILIKIACKEAGYRLKNR